MNELLNAIADSLVTEASDLKRRNAQDHEKGKKYQWILRASILEDLARVLINTNRPECVRDSMLDLLSEIKEWDIQHVSDVFMKTGKVCTLTLPHDIREKIQGFLSNN